MTTPITRAQMFAALDAKAVAWSFLPRLPLAPRGEAAWLATPVWAGRTGGEVFDLARNLGLGVRFAREAIAAAAAGPQDAPADVALDVGDLLDPRFAAEACALAREAGRPPSALAIRVAEDDLSALGEAGFAALERLRARGFALTLDGRGAGRVALDGRARSLFGALVTQAGALLTGGDDPAHARRLAAARAAGLVLIAAGADDAGLFGALAAAGADAAEGPACGPAFAETARSVA